MARRIAREHFLRGAEVRRSAASVCLPAIDSAAHLIVRALVDGNKILACGNGGSAADCQHWAAEFVGRLYASHPRRALPAIALTTDTSFLTAHANDCGYESIFERQVEALGRPGDVLVGITTSGNSPNVIRALRVAKDLGLKTVALTGQSGLKDADGTADVTIAVPSGDTQLVQETHLVVEHALCCIVEAVLFPPEEDDKQ